MPEKKSPISPPPRPVASSSCRPTRAIRSSCTSIPRIPRRVARQKRSISRLISPVQAAGCEVSGISRDSLKSHENFKAKQELPFELFSDGEEKACALFGVIKMKNMYGKQVRGIERSTFVIDGEGVLARNGGASRCPVMPRKCWSLSGL